MIAMLEYDGSIEAKVLRTHKEEGVVIETYGSMLTPHYFRHNYASVLYNAGVDVLSAQRFLGHSNPATTMAIYTHLSAETEDKSAEKTRLALSAASSNDTKQIV